MTQDYEYEYQYKIYATFGGMILFDLFLFVYCIQYGHIEGTWYDWFVECGHALLLAFFGYAIAQTIVRDHSNKKLQILMERSLKLVFIMYGLYLACLGLCHIILLPTVLSAVLWDEFGFWDYCCFIASYWWVPLCLVFWLAVILDPYGVAKHWAEMFYDDESHV